MPDNDRPGVPPGSGSTALQLRPTTELSTQVLSPTLPEQEDDEALHFRDLWRIVVKRKWVVFAVVLLALATALVSTMMQTPIYRATITLKIEREAAKIVDFKGVQPEEYGDIDFYRTQYELLKSRTLSERVVEQLNLRRSAGNASEAPKPWWLTLLDRESGPKGGGGENRAEPLPESVKKPNLLAVGAFQGSLIVDPIRSSRLVRVHFDSPDPTLAADALNALAQNFIAVNLERRFDASSYAKTFLEEKLSQTKTKLEESERQLVEFQRAQEIINVDEKQNVLAQTLSAYNQAASKAGEERMRSEAMYQEFKANPESTPQMLDNKSLVMLKEERAKRQIEYQDGLKVYKPAFPKMLQLQATIDELDKKINEEIEIVRRSIEGQYKVAVQQEQSVLAKLDAAKKGVLDLQNRSIKYNILKREVDTNRSLYDGLLQRLKEVGVEAGVVTNNVTVVDPALPPGGPYKPNLNSNLNIAVVIGLILGIAIAFFLEYLDDTLRHPEDMEKLTKLPVLGVIPLVKSKKGNESPLLAMMSHVDARSGFAEAYRSVRTALQFATRDGAPRQIVVTSTSAGEGKTTTALSLAINFAQAGKLTLLIDADLRNPTLHKYLGIDNSRGLSNYLSSDMPALGVVRLTSVPNLYVIPAGPLPPNPVELLSGPKLHGMLRELGERFPQVILDAPPVLGIADALVLGNQVGAVLFVVAAAGTRKAHAKAALKRLRQAAVIPLGAVMTKLDLRDGMYGYESAYYYYQSTSDVPKLT
jgi:capsular exopolysaccharide synthesis family protein